MIMFHVKIGSRNIDMPGARIVDTVARMLTAVRMPESPVSATATIQRSPPSPGERMPSDSGVYANHPKLAAPFDVKKPDNIVTPPAR